MKKKRKSSSPSANASPKKWSAKVGRESDALDLEKGVFTKGSAKEIAHSLKQSAENSERRQGQGRR